MKIYRCGRKIDLMITNAKVHSARGKILEFRGVRGIPDRSVLGLIGIERES